jgi:hypothetical protein
VALGLAEEVAPAKGAREARSGKASGNSNHAEAMAPSRTKPMSVIARTLPPSIPGSLPEKGHRLESTKLQYRLYVINNSGICDEF